MAHLMKEKVSATQKALNVWAIILILWSFYRFYFRTDLSPFFDELVAKPIIFLWPLYYYITHYEHKDFAKAVDLRTDRLKKDIWLGLGLGGVFLLTTAITYWFRVGNIANVVEKLHNPFTLMSMLVLAFVSSFSEEILSRGFVLNRLDPESKNHLKSIAYASFLFFFLRIPILFTMNHLTGITLLQVMLTDMLLSIAVSLLYLQRRDIFLPILIHTLYSISIYLFLR